MFRAYFRRKPWASRAYGGAAAILVLLLAQLKVALMINHLHIAPYGRALGTSTLASGAGSWCA
jgi:hypothetical protein